MLVYSKIEKPFKKLILLSILFFNSCEKLDLFNKEKENDSITLKYADINPDTNWIDFDNDNYKDFVILDTTSLWFQSESESIYIPVQYAISKIPSIAISYGKKDELARILLLGKDSVINNSLVWTDHYISYGLTNFWPMANYTEYIGIRKIENNDTLFGWVHRSYSKITEYAIDTTQQSNRVIYAGRYYK